MEDLAYLELPLDSNLNSFEDLCVGTMSTAADHTTHTNLPQSELSVDSWTFSPISENNNGDAGTDDLDSSECELNHVPNVTNQQLHNLPAQPITNTITSKPVNSNMQQRYDVNNRSCEYHEYAYPNKIMYHQSVNIHNYVGNYCMGQQPSWKPNIVYQMPGPAPCFPAEKYEHHPQQVLQMAEQNDPLSTLNTAGMDFTRCTTPEYLMALNSLNQMDSTPQTNHAAAMNYTYSSFNESLHNKSASRPMQDSGYSSDLSESPIIQFQDGNIKLRQSRLTSTPQPPPVMRLTNPPSMNKENVPPIQPQFQSPRINQYMNMFQNSIKPQEIVNPCAKDNTVPSVDSISETKTDKTELLFSNMAEYQQAKKTAASRKRKPSAAGNDDNDSKRRHNEPLNNTALQAMNEWYACNALNPYPSKADKEELAKKGGISLPQVKSWFANKRNRSNNTRPKKQKQETIERLMTICHQLARDASKPEKDNAYYIQQLSSVMTYK